MAVAGQRLLQQLQRPRGAALAPAPQRQQRQQRPGRRCGRVVVRAAAGGGGGGPDDLEAAFAEELKRRGLDSLDGGSDTANTAASGAGSSGAGAGEPVSPFAQQQSAAATTTRTASGAGAAAGAAAAAAAARSTEGQRERSIALVNEGLEGLFPRAAELLKLGGSVFLAFAPFIVVAGAAFAAIYAVFGDSFVHGGRDGVGVPSYVDPADLLSAPTVDPMVPFRAPPPLTGAGFDEEF